MTDERTIADLTGDLVLYRDLHPYDRSLPDVLEQLRGSLGLSPADVPRKRNHEYARIVFSLLQYIQAQRTLPALEMLLVVGDTNNDRWMAEHLRTASGLPVFACIGTDRPDEAPSIAWEGDTATVSRWAQLDEWLSQLTERHKPVQGSLNWDSVALILDIDKTLLGPRGRNDDAINEARAEAALLVARNLLGSRLDAARFQDLYDTLCRSEFHGLTLDNQDYVVYITLLLAAEVLQLDEVRRGIDDGTFAGFTLLLDAVGPRVPTALADLHTTIRSAHEAGDPTPFKTFRRAEFATTLARMGDGRLTLCREVLELAQRLGERGALCLAASDKPAESALPTPEQEAAGLAPLHRTPAEVA
jgi:hypothetical protein